MRSMRLRGPARLVLAIALGAVLIAPARAQVSDEELQRMMEDVAGRQAAAGTTALPETKPGGAGGAFGGEAVPRTPGNALPGGGAGSLPPAGPGGDGRTGEAAQAAIAPPPPVVRKWGALAAALWRRRGKAHVATGSAVRYETKQQAINEAISRCRSAGGGRSCKVVTTFNIGCGFIATGRSRRGAGWASGKTSAAAASKCRKQGYSCKPPIGGCLD